MKKSVLILLLSALAVTACGPRKQAALYPVSQRHQVAQEVLEFHEDRFLADHNEELAQAWKDYRQARERLVELWRRHASTAHVDAQQQREAEKEIAAAKAEFVESAERLRELSRNMASEAAEIVRAALRIPPVLESEKPR